MTSKQDIQVKVVIEADGSSAKIQIPATTAPADVTLDTLSAIATGAGVKINVKVQSRLGEIAKKFCENPSTIEEVFAEAQAPVNGADGTLAWEDEFDPDAKAQEMSKLAGSDEKVDFYAGARFIHVKSDDHVATLHMPTDGADGVTVTGKLIKAKPGKPCPLQLGQGLFSPDKQKVMATDDGILLVKDGVVFVSKVLEIDGFVDFETGNIDFDGDVLIRQGVRDLFVVKSTGNIEVDGLIESAHIDCGGNLLGRRGACGRTGGEISVKGDAEIGFLDNVRGTINGTLKVHREIINCTLSIGGDLLCETGTAIGGTIAAGGNVHIRTLGSDGERLTLLELGAMPILTDKLRFLDSRIHTLTTQLGPKQEKLKLIQQQGKHASAQDREQMTELSYEIDEMQRELAEASAQKAQLQIDLEQAPKSKIRVDSIIYPSVRLLAGRHQIIFDQPIKGPVIFGLDERRNVTFQVTGGSIRPITEIARVAKRSAIKPDDPHAKPVAA